MTIVRSIFVSIVAVGVGLMFSNASLGRGAAHEEHEHHESEHHESEHTTPHEHKHEAHHDEHHETHHDAHHDEHHYDHHDANHDDRHHDKRHEINHADWYKHEWWRHQLSWHDRSWRHWWHRPTTGEIATWSTGWGLTAPIYYDYGPGGNVVYRNNEVYVNGNLAGTPDAYAKSVTALANASPGTDAKNNQPGEWLSLGTFAVLRKGADDKPSQTLQLGMDKNGSVSGMLFDLPKDTATPIRGSLDRATQRVAFDLGAKSGLVAETGLYNLTKDEVTLLVHKGNEKPKTYTLVRFQTPPANPKEKDIALLSK
jgi:hypothetical protein